MKKLMMGVVVMMAWSGAASAEDALVTDRPDVAESSRVVGAGRVQLEIGADADAGAGIGVPTKLRVGVLDNLELHVESSWVALREGVAFEPIDVGGKVHLWGEEGSSLGLLVAVSIPVGGGLVVLSPTLAFDQDLASWLGLGVNVGADVNLTGRDAGQDVVRWAAAFGFGLSEQWSLYAEGFGEVALGGGVSVSTDAGATFLIHPSFQLDGYLRVADVAGARTPGAGLGASVRW